jgi:cellulose synthase/poly-beta-1,6-N-acetylglucosamine synthase-like glycosyltransferase
MLSAMLLIVAGVVAIPVFVFCIEILFGLTVSPVGGTLPANEGIRSRIAVLIPAHNEGEVLLGSLGNIKAQLHTGDRLLVVADNCTDDTAVIAKGAGAEVTERRDPANIGKGFALAWGIKHLSIDPPSIVLIVDADCRTTNGTVDRLASACAATNRPIQALDLMNAPIDSPIDYRVAAFAFRVKNWVRPLGLNALNLPCQLMGTGMAFPWGVISSANLANALLVEDLKLGLDLAKAGHSPLFCPSARVDSEFSRSSKGAEIQRTRWEKGHVGMIAKTVPSMLFHSVTQKTFPLFVLTLDAAVPPLTLLGLLVCIATALSSLGLLFGISSLPLMVSAASFSAFLIAILLAWSKFGRDILPINSVSLVISYVFHKFLLYRRMIFGRSKPQWIRTDRGNTDVDRK